MADALVNISADDLRLLMDATLPGLPSANEEVKLAFFRAAGAYAAARDNYEATPSHAFTLVYKDKVSAIKMIRHLTNWGLKESKDFVDSGVPFGLTPKGIAIFNKVLESEPYMIGLSLQPYTGEPEHKVIA